MYSWHEYRADIQKAWKPAGKSMRSFGKSLRTLDPFKYVAPCFLMVARLLWLLVQIAFFSSRKLANR